MNIKHLVASLVCACVSFVHGAQASVVPTNFFEPYERLIKEESWDHSMVKIGAWLEDGSTGKGRDFEQDKVDVTRIYDKTQSSIAMLMGAQEGTDLHTVANSLLGGLGSATDDGCRGHFSLNGSVEQTVVTFFGRYRFPYPFLTGHAEIGAFLPVKEISTCGVQWRDLTKDSLNADQLVKQNITSKIDQVVFDLGCLRIRGEKNSGLGDLFLLLRWMRDFRQLKEHLRNVRVVLQGGVSFPTGEEKNEDQAFSFALGCDGAWAIHLGGHLDLNFSRSLRGGLAVNFITLLDDTRVRRMKTDENQTEFLLLSKGRATKSYGPLWKFTFFLQFQDWIKGLSLLGAFQFLKHDHDTLYPQSDCFTHSVVNSAQSLQEWDTHHLLFQLNFDSDRRWKRWWVKPFFSFFVKLPVSGKRSIASHTFGGQLGFSF